MTTPDEIVEQRGEEVTLERVVDFEIDANGQVTNKETELETVKAVISNPSEQDTQRLEGRLSTGSLRLTLPSGADVAGDRDGQRDRIYRPAMAGWSDDGWGDSGWGGVPSSAQRYRVVEVRDDRNPLTGTSKMTVIVDTDGGRVPHPTPTEGSWGGTA